MSKNFSRKSLVRTKEITFSFQVEFQKHESMRKIGPTIVAREWKMVQFYFVLTYPYKKFHASAKLYRICYLEDRNSRL